MSLKKEINTKILELYKSEKKEIKFIPGVTKISVTGKVINHKEIQYITQSAIDGWLTTGRFNDKFENKLTFYKDGNFSKVKKDYRRDR